MIDPNQPIQVTLSALQWNAILAQLDEGPHRTMRGLIDSIRDQCMAFDAQHPLAPAPNLRVVPPEYPIPDAAGE